MPVLSHCYLPTCCQNRTARTLRACKIPFFSTLSEPTFNLIAEVSKVITYLEGDIVFQVSYSLLLSCLAVLKLLRRVKCSFDV